jgi:hypothetical protein
MRLTQRRAGGSCGPIGASLGVGGEAYARFLKRQLLLPVSTISQWCVRRSSSAVVIWHRRKRLAIHRSRDRGDDDGRASVDAAEREEQQLAAGLGERQITEVAGVTKSRRGYEVCEPALPSGAALGLQTADQVDGIEEAPVRSAADTASGNGDRKVRFLGNGCADQSLLPRRRETTLCCCATKWPSTRSRTRLWLIGVPLKAGPRLWDLPAVEDSGAGVRGSRSIADPAHTWRTDQNGLARCDMDWRDAIKLASSHRAGELTLVWGAKSGARSDTRSGAGERQRCAPGDQARQQLSSFLLRHGHHRRPTSWTQPHRRW